MSVLIPMPNISEFEQQTPFLYTLFVKNLRNNSGDSFSMQLLLFPIYVHDNGE